MSILKLKIMKKLLIILALVLASCSTPTNETTQSLDCNCGKVVESSSFNVVNPSGGYNTFSVLTMKNNCTGVFKQIQRNGTVNVNTQICNY